MNELSAILPKVELMYLNDYVKYHFSVSQIEIFVKDIEFDMYDWKLSSNDRN